MRHPARSPYFHRNHPAEHMSRPDDQDSSKRNLTLIRRDRSEEDLAWCIMGLNRSASAAWRRGWGSLVPIRRERERVRIIPRERIPVIIYRTQDTGVLTDQLTWQILVQMGLRDREKVITDHLTLQILVQVGLRWDRERVMKRMSLKGVMLNNSYLKETID